MKHCPTCTCQKKVKIGKFIKINPGTFMMGSPADEPGRYDDEVQHEVTLTKGFEMCATQVTQEEYESVTGVNPSYHEGDLRCPVEQVSWDDAQAFIKRLNEKQREYTYRLPTEAEWEYCARAGPSGPRSFDLFKLDDYAWHYGNSSSATHPVAQKEPNPWGLYDMIGNVWEWCADWYGTYTTSDVKDPMGPATGSYRVIRGGSWNYFARYLRSAYRGRDVPGFRYSILGFRLVRSLR